MAAKKSNKKPVKKPAKRKRKSEPQSDPYSEILSMLDSLLDNAEDDIARSALDPLAALRAKCATLTVALRMCLLALSCHGQKKDFAKQIAQNLDTIVKLREVWNNSEEESRQGETGINFFDESENRRTIAEEETDARKVIPDETSARRFKLVEEKEAEEDSDYDGPQEVASTGYAEDEIEGENADESDDY